MGCALFWGVTQRLAVIPYWCFGTTHRFHLQGNETQGCPETSVSNDHQALRNNLEERRSHVLRCGSLKQRRVQHMLTKLPVTLLH